MEPVMCLMENLKHFIRTVKLSHKQNDVSFKYDVSTDNLLIVMMMVMMMVVHRLATG